ncbi:MAG: hypothetical protein K2N03_07375, partial [Muribaculaceae bacterium]|nr:hypothetical protein [Muribaculaceae bacterium]
KSLVEEFENWKAKNKDNPEEKQVPLREGFIEELRLMEFFVLCSAFHVDVKSTKDLPEMIKEYRSQITPYYFKRLTGVKNIAFDILKPFVSMIYPYQAYNNFGETFYSVCLNFITTEQKSVLGELLVNNRRYKDDNKVSPFSDLASRIAIRNMEVLTHLYNFINNRAKMVKVGMEKDGVPGMYRELLNSVALNFSVKTYSVSEDNTHYHIIGFEPLSVLVKVMTSVINKPNLKSLFNDCFAEVVVEKREPEEGSIESKLLTRGYYYTSKLIREIIFKHYPKYREEFEANTKSEFHKRLTDKGGLKKRNGEDVLRYLVSITDKEHPFDKILNDNLKEEYEAILKKKNKQVPDQQEIPFE